MDRVRIAIFGLGKMGSLHLEKYLSIEDAEVIGFYDTDPVRAGAAAEKYKIKSFTAIEELLFEADAVVISSPTPTHYLIARQALLSGVHVFVEKPIAETTRQAEDLVSLAALQKVILQVGFVERFRLQRLLSYCPVEPLIYVDAERYTVSLGREKSIDVVPDLMLHDLDLVQSLMKEEPSRLLASGTTLVREKTDIAVAHLDFPSGAMASLRVSRVSNRPVRKLELLYDSAVAKIDLLKNSVDVSYGRPGGEPVHRVYDVGSLDPLLEQCQSFLRVIRGEESVVVSGSDGLRSLRWAEAVVRAVKRRGQKRAEGKIVPLRPSQVEI